MSSLEVYSFAGHEKPFDLPAIDDLYEWEDYSKRGAFLTKKTLRRSAAGEETHRAEDAEDLFDQLGI